MLQGAKIQYIQGATKTRVVIAVSTSLFINRTTSTASLTLSPSAVCPRPQAQPGDDWESAWFQVMVKGPPSGCYQAFKMISGLVDGASFNCTPFCPTSLCEAGHPVVVGAGAAAPITSPLTARTSLWCPSRLSLSLVCLGVAEVDDCVASFPIPRPKHSLVIGK